LRIPLVPLMPSVAAMAFSSGNSMPLNACEGRAAEEVSVTNDSLDSMDLMT
jgi:hypothetical protein